MIAMNLQFEFEWDSFSGLNLTLKQKKLLYLFMKSTIFRRDLFR